MLDISTGKPGWAQLFCTASDELPVMVITAVNSLALTGASLTATVLASGGAAEQIATGLPEDFATLTQLDELLSSGIFASPPLLQTASEGVADHVAPTQIAAADAGVVGVLLLVAAATGIGVVALLLRSSKSQAQTTEDIVEKLQSRLEVPGTHSARTFVASAELGHAALQLWQQRHARSGVVWNEITLAARYLYSLEMTEYVLEVSRDDPLERRLEYDYIASRFRSPR